MLALSSVSVAYDGRPVLSDVTLTVPAADAYARALDGYTALGGYELEARVDRTLGELRLAPELLDRPMASLSGGQRVRVGLAALLASQADLYLLDEPTNALDLDGLDRLGAFLSATPATVLVVSHDRAFLEAVATDVVELDPATSGAIRHGVPFAAFRELRARADAAARQRYRTETVEVARLRAAQRTAALRARRNGDTRAARDNDKGLRSLFAEGAQVAAAGTATRIERQIERREPVEQPRSRWELRLSLDGGRRAGDDVAHVEGVVLRRGAFTLGPVSFALGWGERVALGGPNGAGKSLLVGLLAGDHRPDAGTVRLGSGVRIGVLRQGGVALGATEDTGLAAFRAAVPATAEAEARTLLAKFDLGADDVLRPVPSWSPGERCRLGLAILVARGANVLVLDEPTTHLDLDASEELRHALAAFTGTLVVVSHDRALLAGIGITRHLELAHGRLVRDRARLTLRRECGA